LVWLLAVICALAMIALVTVRVHPSWLSFLRSAPPPTTSSAGQPSSPSSDSTSGSMTLVSTTPRAITYNVPIRTFSIVVHPITDSYVEVHSPSTSHSFAYAEVVHKAAKPTALSVTGSASIEIFRQASLLEITSGSHVIGTIKTPKDNTSYVFIAPKG
jgi:hypothetical protein